MKRPLIAASLLALSITALAGNSDKITLANPLIVARTREEAKNLAQMIDDNDRDGMKAEYEQGALDVIKPGETVYITSIGLLDGIDTVRYHGKVFYAPNHEVSKLVYGNE